MQRRLSTTKIATARMAIPIVNPLSKPEDGGDCDEGDCGGGAGLFDGALGVEGGGAMGDGSVTSEEGALVCGGNVL
ncbi:hypothetical protein ACFX13_018039 [Malus domestica]